MTQYSLSESSSPRSTSSANRIFRNSSQTPVLLCAITRPMPLQTPTHGPPSLLAPALSLCRKPPVCRHRPLPTLARLALTALHCAVVTPDREARNPRGLRERVAGRGDDEHSASLLSLPGPHETAQLGQFLLLAF